MHRSRLSLLVIAVTVAACSARDEPAAAGALSRDSALATTTLDSSLNTDKLPFPDACGAVATPDQPAAAGKREAAELARRAYVDEMLGNMRDADQLLRRAATLDWTDKSSAYHLGRVSEALGARDAAVKAYCRFLALGPTATEQREASKRIMNLSQPTALAAVGPNSSATNATSARTPAAPVRGATPKPAMTESRVIASRSSTRSDSPRSSGRAGTASTSVAAGGTVDLPPPTRSVPASPAPVIVAQSDSVATTADGVDARPATSANQPATSANHPATTVRRSPTTAQAAGIGALAGAIIGGVTGRSAKSAAIGAVAGATAGGVLGTVASHRSRSPSHGIR